MKNACALAFSNVLGDGRVEEEVPWFLYLPLRTSDHQLMNTVKAPSPTGDDDWQPSLLMKDVWFREWDSILVSPLPTGMVWLRKLTMFVAWVDLLTRSQSLMSHLIGLACSWWVWNEANFIFTWIQADSVCGQSFLHSQVWAQMGSQSCSHLNLIGESRELSQDLASSSSAKSTLPLAHSSNPPILSLSFTCTVRTVS